MPPSAFEGFPWGSFQELGKFLGLGKYHHAKLVD